MSKILGRQINHPHDFVATPEKAVLSLVPHLPLGLKYFAPCYGDGDLVRALNKHTMTECVGWSELRPTQWSVPKDAATLTSGDINGAEAFIENPPWSVHLLHPILDNLLRLRPVWFLLYADWLFTRQAVPYLPYIRRVVTMPRQIWIPGTKDTGTANCCWIHFDPSWKTMGWYGWLSGWPTK